MSNFFLITSFFSVKDCPVASLENLVTPVTRTGVLDTSERTVQEMFNLWIKSLDESSDGPKVLENLEGVEGANDITETQKGTESITVSSDFERF